MRSQKSKSKKSKVKGRNFVVEGSDQKVAVLADRMMQQCSIASTPTPITLTANNLPHVPNIGNFPDMLFYWCAPSLDKDGVEDSMGTIVQMMKVLHNEEIEIHIESVLQLYLNITVLIYPQIKPRLNIILKSYGFTTEDKDWAEVLEELEISEDEIAIDNESTPKSTVIMATAGIYLCLIGKQLNSQNYTNWIKSRIRSFAASCAVEATNTLISELVPATTHSVSIYTSVSARWEIRREVFLFIRASSKAIGQQATMARCCMVLLSGAELGNFSLTNKYIIIQNPVLLCWQELAKHAPTLISAVDKYQSLGEDGPYCKLLYPPQELQEFTQYGLRIFAAIARKIALQEGMDSLKNYAGADTSNNISLLITKAMYLVKAAGGANTHTTEGIRNMFLVKGPENAKLISDLGLGAYVEGAEDSSDSDSNEEDEHNIAV